jgi:hypothetical protein
VSSGGSASQPETQLWAPMSAVGNGALASSPRTEMRDLARKALRASELADWKSNLAERVLGAHAWACAFRLTCPEDCDKEEWAELAVAAAGWEQPLGEMGDCRRSCSSSGLPAPAASARRSKSRGSGAAGAWTDCRWPALTRSFSPKPT